MNNALFLTVSACAGIASGIFFFGGLWWTIKKGVVSEKPFFWFMGSLLIRSGVTLACFYFFSRYGSGSLLACLAGFFVSHIGVKIILFPAGAGRS